MKSVIPTKNNHSTLSVTKHWYKWPSLSLLMKMMFEHQSVDKYGSHRAGHHPSGIFHAYPVNPTLGSVRPIDMSQCLFRDGRFFGLSVVVQINIYLYGIELVLFPFGEMLHLRSIFDGLWWFLGEVYLYLVLCDTCLMKI